VSDAFDKGVRSRLLDRLRADPPSGSLLSHHGSASARPQLRRYLVVSVQGGITLGLERGGLGDDFCSLGENIIEEYAPQFENQKQLARELRSGHFPIRDGAIITGTFRDSDILYDRMAKAFDRAIGYLGKEVQANA
jgi:hypothetical protein